MLAKANRLTKEADFKKVARKSKPTHSKYLILKKISAPKSETKFGLVISTKVSKKSTERNKIRRKLRQIIRLNIKRIKPDFQVMLVVKNSILNQDYQSIRKDLEELLKKVRLI